jgi:uncharacterized protein (TIGR04255 family)
MQDFKSMQDKQVETYPHLSKAPINEAILEILVDPPITENIRELGTYTKTVSELQGSIRENKTLQNVRRVDIGYLYNDANHKVIQVRLNGFSFSITNKQYNNWDSFSLEAKRFWEIYLSHFKPESIVKISLRFINQIDIPLPIRDFEDFLKTKPEIGASIPSSLESMFMQLNIRDQENDANISITETFNPPNNETLPFLLDIDVQKEAKLPCNSSDVLWKNFLVLRGIKNKVFFNSITEQTLNLLL